MRRRIQNHQPNLFQLSGLKYHQGEYLRIMSSTLSHDLEPKLIPGTVTVVGPGIRRIVANNPGPHTFTGTNTYIVGYNDVAVIDPGPRDESHLEKLLDALSGERVSHVLITHTHRDHSPLTRELAHAKSAQIFGMPISESRPERSTEGIESTHDIDFNPDVKIQDGDLICGPNWKLEAIHTPGHAENHVCFSLVDTDTLFSGDHVMGWSTTMIAPPDGHMASYFSSLDRLSARGDTLYLPGHGREVTSPGDYVRALGAHRRARETSIRSQLKQGPADAIKIAQAIYPNLEPKLMRAAALTTLAHLVHLQEQGIAESSNTPQIDEMFWLIGP